MMRRRKLTTIARRWWSSRGGDYAWNRVWDMTLHRRDLMPALINSLVETAPEGAITYVGTAIVEDLMMDHPDRGDFILDLVLRARLSREELFEVLAGCYPHYLEALGVPTRLASVFSSDQIAWLTNGDTLRLDGGRALPEGDNVWIDPRKTPWQIELDAKVAHLR